jgi:hypothetical protein
MLERVKNLNWPASLFSLPYLNVATTSSAAPLLADARKKSTSDHLCACDCKLPHRYAVSRVIERDGPFGYNRSVAWYRNLDHRNKHAGLVS